MPRNARVARAAVILPVPTGAADTHAGPAGAAGQLPSATACSDPVILHARDPVFGADMPAPVDRSAAPA